MSTFRPCLQRRTSLSVELNRLDDLCKEVNPDLTQKQKVVIILELINIIQADGDISDRERSIG